MHVLQTTNSYTLLLYPVEKSLPFNYRFSLFVFNVIIDKVGFKSTFLLFVFYSSFYSFLYLFFFISC